MYIGVTSNLVQRIYQHKNNLADGFTKKYQMHTLVYFESYEDINEAIKREKALKGSSRLRKIRLIVKSNPHFIDLYGELLK